MEMLTSSGPQKSALEIDFANAHLRGQSVTETVRTLADLRGIFADTQAFTALAPETLAYRVQAFFPVPEGTAGGLFWGNTVIEPGKVGSEYFMTKGHFHADRERGEYYIGVAGEGALILMDENRRTRWEKMTRGSVHYIPARTAHRVANIGREPLAFLACWSSEAGHDYKSIEVDGFSARLLDVEGEPRLVPSPEAHA